MINQATEYLSPDLNKANRLAAHLWSRHDQPRDTDLVIAKVRQIPRRSRIVDEGYDALAISVIECTNDGRRVALVTSPPAPRPGEIYHYSNDWTIYTRPGSRSLDSLPRRRCASAV